MYLAPPNSFSLWREDLSYPSDDKDPLTMY